MDASITMSVERFNCFIPQQFVALTIPEDITYYGFKIRTVSVKSLKLFHHAADLKAS